jgi:long-chain acyl-CoA synthetase
MALADTLRAARRHHPDKPALIVGDETWSYSRFDVISDRIAGSFLALGIQPGDRIALHFTNSAELVLAYYACFKSGAIAVPLNTRLKGPELQYILLHCAARFYLGEPELFTEAMTVRSELPQLERVYLTGDSSGITDVYSLRQLSNGSMTTDRFPEIHSDAPAVILYTSGTTARPKGVTHTHATLESTIANYRRYCELTGDATVGIVLSMAHIFAFALLLLPTVAVGGTLLVIPRFEPSQVLRSLSGRRATHFGALPVMYQALVDAPDANAYNLRGLRFCIAGGDAVPTELQRRFQQVFGVPITEACGMTEVIPYAGNPPHGRRKSGSIGPPTPGTDLRIADDAGRELATGEVGEILVRSEAATIGYWKDPEATAATLKNGWLHTGDLGRVDQDGCYWFVGRKKEIIVRGGSNISPLEVEEALYQHPEVKEAGVIGVPDEALGQIVWAYVALQAGSAADEAELKQFLTGRLAAYKVPDTIRFLPELPKGLTGKIHRKTLQEQVKADREIG